MHRAIGAVAVAIALTGCASVSEDFGLTRALTVHRGHASAESRCAKCHTIAGDAVSPAARAITFAEIAKRYTRNGLEWELQAISDVGHYGMPATPLSRDEVKDLVAYIHPRRGPS